MTAKELKSRFLIGYNQLYNSKLLANIPRGHRPLLFVCLKKGTPHGHNHIERSLVRQVLAFYRGMGGLLYGIDVGIIAAALLRRFGFARPLSAI